jgi:hypothetical protein
MVAFFGFKAITKKALIHAPGVGYQPMKLLALCCLDTKEQEFTNTPPTSEKHNVPKI